MYKLMTLKWSA